MACNRCEISTFIKDNGVDLFFVTETWLSAQGAEAKIAELEPSGFDVKSFPRQSRSRGGGIATMYKSTLGSNITFKTKLLFYSHIVRSRAGINYFTAQHYIFSVCTDLHQTDETTLLTLCLPNSCLTFLIM